jgi:hypothetical protein
LFCWVLSKPPEALVTPPGVGLTPPSPWPLYRAPVMMGRSMSLPRNCTSTSWPTRGRNCMPMPAPALRWATRTQQLALPLVAALDAADVALSVSAPAPLKRPCQGKQMRTRPSRSVYRSPALVSLGLPLGPTTRAVCAPGAVAWGSKEVPAWWVIQGRHTTSARSSSHWLA